MRETAQVRQQTPRNVLFLYSAREPAIRDAQLSDKAFSAKVTDKWHPAR
jgi:hypothetical protein